MTNVNESKKSYIRHDFAIVFILCIAQLANFHVSAHLISILLVFIITTVISKSSYHIEVQRHGPALGVTPVFITFIPL